MILLQIESLTNGQILGSGIWDNLIWPIMVAAILAGGGLIWKRISQKKKKETRPTINLVIDEHWKIQSISDNRFHSKIQLAKQITRETKQKGIFIKLVPNYNTKQLDKYEKEDLKLGLKKKEEEIEQKIQILLIKPIELGLEQIDNLKTVINTILAGQLLNVTGRVKIDIYRNHEPQIYFPVYVTQNDFQKMAQKQNKSIKDFKQELSIPTMCSMAIFDSELLYREVIPALVQEIYRLYTGYDFDLNTNNWENILLYEVGLG